MLLPSGVTTMYLGWTKSWGSQVLGSLQAIFCNLRSFHAIYFILFLKFFIDRFLFQLCFYLVAFQQCVWGGHEVLGRPLAIFWDTIFRIFHLTIFLSILLLSSGVTTMYLGWTKSRGPEVLRSLKAIFWSPRFFHAIYFILFYKFSLIDFSFNDFFFNYA